MIELKVEKYCHNCEGFVPKAVSVGTLAYGNELTEVICENSRKCMRMYEHIKKEMSKSNEQ